MQKIAMSKRMFTINFNLYRYRRSITVKRSYNCSDVRVIAVPKLTASTDHSSPNAWLIPFLTDNQHIPREGEPPSNGDWVSWRRGLSAQSGFDGVSPHRLF